MRTFEVRGRAVAYVRLRLRRRVFRSTSNRSLASTSPRRVVPAEPADRARVDLLAGVRAHVRGEVRALRTAVRTLGAAERPVVRVNGFVLAQGLRVRGPEVAPPAAQQLGVVFCGFF